MDRLHEKKHRVLLKKKKKRIQLSIKVSNNDRYIEYLNSLGGGLFFISEQPHPISLDAEPTHPLSLRQLCVVELARSKLAGLLC